MYLSLQSLGHRITQNDIQNNSHLSAAIKAQYINDSYIKINDLSYSSDGDKIQFKEFYVLYDGANDGIQNDTTYTYRIEEDTVNGHETAEEVIVLFPTNTTVEVKNINSFKLTFITTYNELGNYYIKGKSTESITQLPPVGSPLCAELSGTGKSAISDWSIVKIDNLKPSFNFKVEAEKVINLVFQFDHVMTDADRKYVDDVVRKVEAKGIRVNKFVHENKF